jgi:hypothetical protein
LLGYRLLWGLFRLRSGTHAVDKHTSQGTSGRIKNTHLHGFSNLLLIATIVFSNLLGGL